MIEEHGATLLLLASCLCSGRLHNRLHQTMDSSRAENAETAALVLPQAPDDE